MPQRLLLTGPNGETQIKDVQTAEELAALQKWMAENGWTSDPMAFARASNSPQPQKT